MNDQDWITFLATQIVTPGMRVLDIGANEGLYAERFARAGAEVWAIEPSEASCQTLRAAGRGIRILQVAAGAVNGPWPFWHAHNDSKQHSFWRQLLPQPASGVEMTVAVRTLDALMATGELPPTFDLVKVDCQGAEGDILSHASQLLGSDAAWMIELWPHGLERSGWTCDAVVAMLDAFAYTPYLLQKQRLIATDWSEIRRQAAGLLAPSALNVGLAKPQTAMGRRWQQRSQEQAA